MQIHRYGYGIRGFVRLYDHGLRFLVMVSKKAQYRVLRFWESYGLEGDDRGLWGEAALYQWRKQLREGGEDLEALNEKSRTPRTRRKRLWPKAIGEEIRRSEHIELTIICYRCTGP